MAENNDNGKKPELSPEERASLKEELLARMAKKTQEEKAVKLDPDDLDPVAGGVGDPNCQHDWEMVNHKYTPSGINYTEVTDYLCKRCGARMTHWKDGTSEFCDYSYD